MYAIYDYYEDSDTHAIIAVVSTEAIAKKAISYLIAKNPFNYRLNSDDKPCFEEISTDYLPDPDPYNQVGKLLFIPDLEIPPSYFSATFGVAGKIRLEQIREPGEFTLDMSKAEWEHVACWGESNFYGSVIQGKIKCIKADTEEEAAEQAERERDATLNKAPAFFVHRMGIFLVTPLSMVRATKLVFSSYDEAFGYAKKEVPGFGADPNLKVLSYAEAGRMFSKMEAARKIREKNIKLLVSGGLQPQPVLCGLSEAVADDEHF
jgi:hypothetical protein